MMPFFYPHGHFLRFFRPPTSRTTHFSRLIHHSLRPPTSRTTRYIQDEHCTRTNGHGNPIPSHKG
ncbi:hypothetical protein BKA80DRAFT_283028 [Phyllosticta citrichinensis]